MATSPGVFGAEAGFQAFDDSQAEQAQTSHTIALTRLATSQANAEDSALAQRQRIQALLTQPSPPEPGDAAPNSAESLIGRTERIANLLLDGGDFKGGGELAAKASQMREHNAQIMGQQAQAKMRTLDMQDKALETIGGL